MPMSSAVAIKSANNSGGATRLNRPKRDPKTEVLDMLSRLRQPASALIEQLSQQATYASEEEHAHLRALIRELRLLSSLSNRS